MTLAEIIIICREQDAAKWIPEDGGLSLERWIKDAAAEIQRRRGGTTTKEYVYTFVADTQVYDLPGDFIRAENLIVQMEGFDARSSFGTDFPNMQLPIGPYGFLPNGQSITPALDLVRRQAAGRDRREIYKTTRDGKIYMHFPVVAGKTATLVYEAEDRDPSSIPDRYLELVVKYVRVQSMGNLIDRSMSVGDFVANQFLGRNIGEMRTWRDQAMKEWEEGLRGIPKEGNS